MNNMKISEHFSSYIFDWDYHHYLNIGGYGSGKSHATAQKIILKLYEEKRTCLVLRNVFQTIHDSCFSLIKEILEECELLAETKDSRKAKIEQKVIAIESPMEFRFPNGSRIIFRGADKAEKLKSMHGISIVWIEEASEIAMSIYEELLGRIRHATASLHFILTCNPIGKENWIYKRFFRTKDRKTGKEKVIQNERDFYSRRKLINKNINKQNGGAYYIHSVVDDNPYMPKTYVSQLDELKDTDPMLWIVARWGRFGVNGLRVLPNFRIASDRRAFMQKVRNIKDSMHFFGLDFGFEESYNALISCAVDDEEKILYIYDEVYMNGITDDKFCMLPQVQRVNARAKSKHKSIRADCAEPKTIAYYRNQGFSMVGCKKYAGSRLDSTKKMKRFRKIICSPKCVNTIRELQDLTYKKDKQGNVIYDEFNIDPHTLSGLWYGLETYNFPDLKNYKTNTYAA